MKKIILLMILSFSAQADWGLIVPVITTHVGAQEYYDQVADEVFSLNNSNHGLGFEYKDYEYSAGITYLEQNSFREESIYIHLVKNHYYKDLTLSYGVAIASGYELIIDGGIMATPLFSVQYHNFRLVTSYPIGNIVDYNDMGTDFFNIQYVVEF